MKRKGSHHRIAAAFVFVALGLFFLAAEHRGGFWALLWPAFNCLWVGAAYYGVSGKVFGKRSDGSLPMISRILLFPFLTVNWAVWHLQNFLSKEDAFNEVAPGLFLGRRVRGTELPASASLLIDMTSEFPSPGYPAGLSYLCLPTLDAFAPSDEDFLAAARKAASWNGVVFVHCANGHGRSAAMAAGVLLARSLAKSLPEAEAMIVRARPLSAWHPAQRAQLGRLEKSLLS